jgi:hypothetical protein
MAPGCARTRSSGAPDSARPCPIWPRCGCATSTARNVDARRGGYRLSDSFETDWDKFRDLSRRGLADPETSIDELKQAMELVSGLPLSNVPADRYAWSS